MVNPSAQMALSAAFVAEYQALLVGYEIQMDSLLGGGDETRPLVAEMRALIASARAAIQYWRNEESFWRDQIAADNRQQRDGNKLSNIA